MQGITTNVPFADYASIDAVNASALSKGRTSMLHMRHAMSGGPTATSKVMRWGTILHTAVLEPERFADEATLWTGKVRNGNAWEEFQSQAPDADLIVTPAEMEKVDAMTKVVRNNHDAAHLIGATQHEVVLQWAGPTGNGKARLDMFSESIIADYKTTGKIEPYHWFKSAWNLWYHGRMGWYVHGCEAITGNRPRVLFIVQESDAPYDCWVCEMSPEQIAEGEEEAVEIARSYHASCVCGQFPGAVDGKIDYEFPGWAQKTEVDMEGLTSE